MSIKELIIEKLKNINEDKLLMEVYSLISKDSDDDIYLTNAEEKKAINAGISDLKSGNVISESEAHNNLKTWKKEVSNGL